MAEIDADADDDDAADDAAEKRAAASTPVSYAGTAEVTAASTAENPSFSRIDGYAATMVVLPHFLRRSVVCSAMEDDGCVSWN